MLDRALEQADYAAKKERFARENDGSAMKRGIGVAAFFHGAGFTGSGERYLASVVGAEGTAEGRVRVLVSSTEFGQGTNTVLSQIAAETLGLPYEDVEDRAAGHDGCAEQRTDGRIADGDGGREAGGVGRARDRANIDRGGFGRRETHAGRISRGVQEIRFRARSVPVAGAKYEPPANIFWDDQKYRGEAYAAYGWAIYVAQVAVDLTSYSVSVEDFVALQEVGRVLNPVLARGQIIGGVAQGIGFALYEKVEWRDGRMQNGQMTNYIMPTSADVPPIRVFFEERGNAHGAYGAKGIGELPMDGPAPAIVNAIEDALGMPFDKVPLLPEDIFDAMSLTAGRSAMTKPGAAKREISFTVNGERKTVARYPMERLLDVLRVQLGLTGAKEGCGEGECGACSVLMDGALVDSCLVPVLQAEGCEAGDDRRSWRGCAGACGAGRVSGIRRRAVRDLHARNDSGGGAFVERRVPRRRWTTFAKGWPEICAAARATCRFSKRSPRQRSARADAMRSDPAEFELVAPANLQAALCVDDERAADGWLPIAGGTDVMVQYRGGRACGRGNW